MDAVGLAHDVWCNTIFCLLKKPSVKLLSFFLGVRFVVILLTLCIDLMLRLALRPEQEELKVT